MSNDQRKQALRHIVKCAVAAERATGFPAEVLAAQCILESGWLASAPGNNCLGIKSYPGAFGRQLLRTREWFTQAQVRRFLALGDSRTAALVQPVSQDGRGRKLYDVQDWFATFPSLDACFEKRVSLSADRRYAPFAAAYRATGNLEAFIRGIAPIYATDANYAEALLRILGQANVKAALAEAREVAA